MPGGSHLGHFCWKIASETRCHRQYLPQEPLAQNDPNDVICAVIHKRDAGRAGQYLAIHFCKSDSASDI